MRALRTLTLLIALAGLSAGRAHAEAKKDTPLSAAESEKLLAFYDELVDQAAKTAGDCKAQAASVESIVARHKSTLELAWAAKKAKKTAPKEVQERLDKRAFELVDALRKCWADPAVKAAFQKMKPPEEKKEEKKDAKAPEAPPAEKTEK